MGNQCHLISAAALGGMFVLAAPTLAAPINYGTFIGATVQYVNVTENSGTDALPLFGAPSVIADSLDFNPVSFNSNSVGAGGIDITDGTLAMSIESLPGNFIDQILFDEAGDFTLAGFGGAGTYASVTANYIIEINEVDGASINPIQIQTAMAFGPSNGNWDLLNDGPGPLVHDAWTGSLLVDITQALIANNVPFTVGATQVGVILDNTLVTTSEAGTQAFIAKKDSGGVTITVTPEPASMALFGLGAALIATRRR